MLAALIPLEQPAEHTALLHFDPTYNSVTAPRSDGQIALAGAPQTGFLMADDHPHRVLRMQPLACRHQLTFDRAAISTA